jgi:glutathione S-transferase
VLVEFISDLFPRAGIFPSDPVQRARARFFIDQADTKFAGAYVSHFAKGGPASDLLVAAEAIQALLPVDQPFALGAHFTAADIAIVPFLLRVGVALGLRGDPEDVWAKLQGAKYARFWQYYQDLKAHPSVTGTYDEVWPSTLPITRGKGTTHAIVQAAVKAAYAKRFGGQK